MSTTLIDQLDALRAHLTALELPELYSVHVITDRGGPGVTVQLVAHHPCPVATGLLTWADTLTGATAQAWRTPAGDSVHLSVTGQLPGGVTVCVYSGVSYTPHGIGADLTPSGSKTMALAALRHLATPEQVTR